MATFSPAPALTFCSQTHRSKMPLFSRFNSKKEPKLHEAPVMTPSVKPTLRDPIAASRARNMDSTNPFTASPRTRRPKPVDDTPPPAYSPPAPSSVVSRPISVSDDSPYAFLTQFDTIFLIDDSGSMAGRSWRETGAALAAITPICTSHDADGIDIYFLNHLNGAAGAVNGGYTNITTVSDVERIFQSVRPERGTPTGTRLNDILKPYLAQVEGSLERQAHGLDASVKPLNIIVITDGVASDDVESVIVQAAKKLDKWEAEPWQIGIQFFQVGREPEAAEDLQNLDDNLKAEHGIRDMVDTVPWSGDDGQVLTADGILKVLLGAVVKKLDRRRGSDERLRQ